MVLRLCIFATMMNYKLYYHTPEGFDDLWMCSDGEMLTGLWFEGSRDEDRFVGMFQEMSLPVVIYETCRWLDLYFSGRQPDFTPAYRIDNQTPFRKRVSEIMCEIPFGKTMTYGEITKRIAGSLQEMSSTPRRMSAQAVGCAVGWNPICLIVPCHRVVGANGNLTGYGGGMKNKIALLKHEGHDMNRFFIPAKSKGL